MQHRNGNGDKYIIRYKTDLTVEDYIWAVEKCRELEKRVKEADFYCENMRTEMLCAIRGMSLITRWNAGIIGEKIDGIVDYASWIEEYKKLWLAKNKKSELDEVVRVLDCCEERTVKI